MDESLSLPCEPRLSNSLLKNRPMPAARSSKKSKKNLELPIGLDETVPLDDSKDMNIYCSQQIPQMIEESPVVFRSKDVVHLSNRNHTLLPNSTDTTLFYVTSAIIDDNSSNQSNEQYSKSNDEMDNQLNSISTLIDDFSTSEDSSENFDLTTEYLEKVRDNSYNCQCADCNSEYPTIANMSWLLVICKKCALIHRRLTSNFLRLQSLLSTSCDHYLIDLLHDYGNRFINQLIDNEHLKPNDQSSDSEREEYIRKKYLDKAFLRETNRYTQDELNQMLYENVETNDYKKTLYLIVLGADPNYSEKMFAVADHAKRHQQIKQMKIILANGGLSEFDLIKSNSLEMNETAVYLSTKNGVLKEFVTRYEQDRLKIYKSSRCLFEIDLNNVLAICNQAVPSTSLKCRSNHSPIVPINSQCLLIVNEDHSSNEYLWVFPNELERSLWIREMLKRQYSYSQLIYTDFYLLMKLNIQEGINAEKQQVLVIIYPGRFVICSDILFDEIDLRKYSSLTYQKNDEFIGVILCLVSNRFLYLSSPISKLMEMLYSCLHQAIQVRTLKDLNKQILTSQNIPVIVERFVNFIFEHGLQTKGIYRQAGSETKIKQLLNECLEDPFTSTLIRENYSEHDVANSLKRFLRQLDIPLLGTRENYYAWLRSTMDSDLNHEQLIQYYRALLKDLKQNFPIHYATLRLMIIHIHTVAMLAEINGMTLLNLISTFAPCLISQISSEEMTYENQIIGFRKMSLDDLDMKTSEKDYEESIGLTNRSPELAKLKRNQSFHSSSRHSISSISQFPLSSSYIHVTPSIQGDLRIMTNLCKYYRELFDITDEEILHEKQCIDTLLTIQNNFYTPRKLDGAMISVYFESRADELNGYAMNVFEDETTADMIIERLLQQLEKSDCFFWALFEVIIDQNLERPMYLCENISEVLYRYRTYLSHELNRQATFVVKLNYIQFEKERLQQRAIGFNNHSNQCEIFDLINMKWTPCIWILEKAVLKIYRLLNNINDRSIKWKSNPIQETNLNGLFDSHALMYTWTVEDLYVYIGSDCRFVHPFDMNEYRVLTILPPEVNDNLNETAFGRSFRFSDRNQMFFWYLELVHINGYDKWTRRASRTMPDGVNYLPLQNYHTQSIISGKKRSDLLRNKFLSKSCHVASNFCRQLRK